MEIILLQNISKLGSTGDCLHVANGYARNFLLPTGKAVRATELNKQNLADIKASRLQENNVKLEQYKQLIEKLSSDTIITIEMQAAEDGKLYGSVSTRDILTSLKQIDPSFSKENIILTEPIKYLGEYKISISCTAEIEQEITVQVIRKITE